MLDLPAPQAKKEPFRKVLGAAFVVIFGGLAALGLLENYGHYAIAFLLWAWERASSIPGSVVMFFIAWWQLGKFEQAAVVRWQTIVEQLHATNLAVNRLEWVLERIERDAQDKHVEYK